MVDRETRIIIAGFGGQGVVLAGELIARACIFEEVNVTAMVSYGAEMRGGTANTTVVLSNGEIGSPVVERPDIAIVLNRPSLEKFEPLIVEGGVIIVNSSMIDIGVGRGGLKVFEIGATDIAKEMGNIRVANVICLGVFLRATGLLKKGSIEEAICEVFSGRRQGLAAINKEALERGFSMDGNRK
ncbi:MAG: 2-oxoacid:acceptor oxidoreductase family protein [Planctomycetota bacterium]